MVGVGITQQMPESTPDQALIRGLNVVETQKIQRPGNGIIPCHQLTQPCGPATHQLAHESPIYLTNPEQGFHNGFKNDVLRFPW